MGSEDLVSVVNRVMAAQPHDRDVEVLKHIQSDALAYTVWKACKVAGLPHQEMMKVLLIAAMENAEAYKHRILDIEVRRPILITGTNPRPTPPAGGA